MAGSKMNPDRIFVILKSLISAWLEAENLNLKLHEGKIFEKGRLLSATRLLRGEMQRKGYNQISRHQWKPLSILSSRKPSLLVIWKRSQLVHLTEDLKSHVIGQDDAVDKIAKAIRRNRVVRYAQPSNEFPWSDQLVSVKTELSNN